jgi:hypothetical protein
MTSFRSLAVFALALRCASPTPSPATATTPPSPSADATSAIDDARGDAGAAEPPETEEERNARLARELDAMEMTPIGSLSGGQTATDPDAGVAVPAPGRVSGSDSLLDASAVVARARAGFRACYQRALQEDPTAGGSLVVKLKVDASGSAVDVVLVVRGSFPESMQKCLKARASQLRFSPSDAGSVEIAVPVNITQ